MRDDGVFDPVGGVGIRAAVGFEVVDGDRAARDVVAVDVEVIVFPAECERRHGCDASWKLQAWGVKEILDMFSNFSRIRGVRGVF